MSDVPDVPLHMLRESLEAALVAADDQELHIAAAYISQALEILRVPNFAKLD